MQVILLKEVRGRGGEGDVIEVNRGYANNYLLREGFAVKATKGNLKQLEERRKNIAKREEVRIADAEALVAKLDGAKVKVDVQVGEEGQLFGSVTSSMIAEAILAELGIEVDRRRIELGKPIKAVGTYPVAISVYRNIKATIDVVVESDASSDAASEASDEAAVEGDAAAIEIDVEVEIAEVAADAQPAGADAAAADVAE